MAEPLEEYWHCTWYVQNYGCVYGLKCLTQKCEYFEPPVDVDNVKFIRVQYLFTPEQFKRQEKLLRHGIDNFSYNVFTVKKE